MSDQRRRLDEILDPTYVDGLGTLEPGALRTKLEEAREEEDAVSYVRRNLHGRLDLLSAEIEAREGGRGTSHSVDALASALHVETGPGRGAHVGLALRAAAIVGHREAERLLSEVHLARLPDLDTDEIKEIADGIRTAEERLSAKRKRLHDVIDAIQAELAERYRDGLEPSFGRLQ